MQPQGPDWWPDWTSQTCVIVASGPSAKDANLEAVRGKARVLVINTSWRLAPWADVLYACDGKWWMINKEAAKKFDGLKISQDRVALRHCPNVKLITCTRKNSTIMMDKLGVTGWGGNGGFQSLNLAAQFGAKKIILVGYDMRLDKGTHWHGKHSVGLNNPSQKNIDGWRKAIDGAAKSLAALGILVINASLVSALNNYPKMTLEEALNGERCLS